MAEIRAILLTDVVDSTQLAQALGEVDLAALWDAHDRLARDLLPSWRGREIDKTDGFLLLFADAADAAGYALAYHRALAGLGSHLKARAGIHLGAVILRENSARDVALGAKPIEVEGLAKPTAARVMSLARGGQTLLTAEAREALVDSALHIQSHGHWLIKGAIEPIEVFELGTEGTVFTPPSDNPKVYRVARKGLRWLPVREIGNNLPQQLAPLIGREREVAELLLRLSQTRLLTLTGIGGIGKTRLSTELAAAAMGDFANGVWFVEFAPLSDPGLVPSTVAQVLGVKEEPARAIEQTLMKRIGDESVLLVLDNCEHLLGACAKLVDLMLRRCANLRILANGREALGVAGEHVFQLSSLSLPDPKQAQTPETVMRSAAVQLFNDRALLVRADFRVTPRNVASLTSICRRLDGIPLAIELAAARVRSLSVDEVHQKLDQRFKLLVGGSRVAMPRQQTLRSLFDWSYDLLQEKEKLTLQQLSVFSGGWTLAAAEQVCSDDGADDGDLLDLLTSLCDKSLVVVEQSARVSRYRLLETLRQYADERLLERGSYGTIRRRHRDYFLTLAEEAAPELHGADQGIWLERIEIEHDNLRTALDWSLDNAEPHCGLRLCGALHRFWLLRGHFSEGRAWCARFLEKTEPGEYLSERAKTLNAAGVLARRQGDYLVARRSLEESLSIQRRLGDQQEVAVSLNLLGDVAMEQGDLSVAQALFEKSLRISRELGELRGVARSLHNLGVAACGKCDFESGQALFKQSLAIAQDLADQSAIEHVLWDLGMVNYQQGNYVVAKGLLEKSLAICRKLGERTGIAAGQHLLGHVALEMHDQPTARRLFEDGLRIRHELGDRPGIAYSLEALAAAMAALGDFSRAGYLWGAAEQLREGIGSPLSRVDRTRYDCQVAAARAGCADGTDFDRAWLKGRVLTLNQAIGLALDDEPTPPGFSDTEMSGHTGGTDKWD
jgi:predicted ATPase/class 3 adenylate cyclase/Tfp pilus assembly protein PilF